MPYLLLVAYGLQWPIAPNGNKNVDTGNAMSMLPRRDCGKHLFLRLMECNSGLEGFL